MDFNVIPYNYVVNALLCVLLFVHFDAFTSQWFLINIKKQWSKHHNMKHLGTDGSAGYN